MSLERRPIRVLFGHAPLAVDPRAVVHNHAGGGPVNGHTNGHGHAGGNGNVAQAPNGSMPQGPPQPMVQTPPIDIHEGPDGLVLEADLPGVTEDRITIQIEENVLTLNARSDARLPEGVSVLHEEFQISDFHRSFILSDEVDRERISAELKNGVLRLVLPKAERVKTRRIEIKTS